jgi:hypothetical protein
MGQIIHPVPVDYGDIDFSWMVGRVIIEVSLLEGGFWRFHFGPDSSIDTQCPWRILEHGRVAVSGEDHGQQFGLPAPVDAVARATLLIASVSITAVELRKGTADILIDFAGDRRLEIIPFSSGYEGWQVRDPFGVSFYAHGGGQISRWPADGRERGR